MQSFKRGLTRRDLLKTAAAGSASYGLGLGGASVARAQSDAKTIRVLSVEDPYFFALKEKLPDFTEATGIEVELESLSYDAMQARLVSAFVSKTSDADVISVDQMWTGQYIDNGWIMPLDEFAKGDASLDLRDFFPEVLYSLNTWRGQLATLPVAAYAQGTIYKKSVLEELGLDAPDASTTWDDYIARIGEIHGKSVGGKQMNGTVICGSQPTPIVHMFAQLAASNGARWFEQFPTGDWDFTPTVDTDAFATAVDQYKRLYELSPPEAINYVWFDAGTRFSTGDVGMFYWWTPYFYLVKNDGYMTGEKSAVMDDYGVAALPKAGSTPQTVSLGGWSFGIPSTSTKAEAAWEFLKWSTSAETQKAMALVDSFNYQFSDFARKSLYADEEIAAIYPYLQTQADMIALGNGKIARPPAPVYTTLEGILGLELNKVLIGEQDTKSALKQIDSLFTNTLKGNFLMPYSLESFDDTPEATAALIDSLAG